MHNPFFTDDDPDFYNKIVQDEYTYLPLPPEFALPEWNPIPPAEPTHDYTSDYDREPSADDYRDPYSESDFDRGV